MARKHQQEGHLPGRRDAVHTAKAAVEAYAARINERADLTATEKKDAIEKYRQAMQRGEATE